MYIVYLRWNSKRHSNLVSFLLWWNNLTHKKNCGIYDLFQPNPPVAICHYKVFVVSGTSDGHILSTVMSRERMNACILSAQKPWFFLLYYRVPNQGIVNLILSSAFPHNFGNQNNTQNQISATQKPSWFRQSLIEFP